MANILVEADLGDEVKRIKGLKIIGSRQRGDAREDSDLDVVFEYEGKMREDDLFNFLHEEEHFFDGIPVDFNPIRADKSGTLDEYLKRAAEYDKEKLAEAKKPAAKKAMPKLEKVDLGEQNDAFDAELDAMFFNPDFDLEEPSNDTLREYDNNNNTQLVEISDFIKAINNNDEAYLNRNRNRFYQIAKTSEFLKSFGLSGDIITVRSGVIRRHYNKDDFHKTSSRIWLALSKELSTGKPLAVVRYNGNDKSFRVYTNVVINGRNAVVGLDVKGIGKNIEVNAVATVFGANNFTANDADILYPRTKEAIQALRERLNRARYPESLDSGNIISQSGAESQAANDTRFFNPNMDIEGGQGGNEYAIMFRHKDETSKQHYERLVKYYGRGIERAGAAFEKALQTGFASERLFSEAVRRLQSLGGKIWLGDIRPEGREHVGDWRIAQGRTTSRIFIPLGNNNAFAIQREIGQILLFNETFGNVLPIRVIGFGQNNGTLYAVGETPTIHPSSANPRLWFLNHGWSIGAMSTGFDEVSPEYYENNRFEVEAKDAQLVTFDGREIPFGVMIFDKRNTEYAKSRKPGKYQGDAVQQTLFFNPNMDVKSEEEIEANNLIHGVKAIRAYAKAGRRDFATFAKAVATRKPEVYNRIKTSLRNE